MAAENPYVVTSPGTEPLATCPKISFWRIVLAWFTMLLLTGVIWFGGTTAVLFFLIRAMILNGYDREEILGIQPYAVTVSVLCFLVINLFFYWLTLHLFVLKKLSAR